MSRKRPLLVNRELSWLSFNERVLQEAEDPKVPLLERLRFLGIFSNNRDEFFRVRVATVKRLSGFNKKMDILQGEEPTELLDKIQTIILKQQIRFDKIYSGLIQELSSHHIYIVDEKNISVEQGKFVKDYFQTEVRPHLFPVILDNTPHFPYLKDKSIYLIIRMRKNDNDKKIKYALVEIPTRILGRFLIIPSEKDKKYIILLDDVIRYNLNEIFSVFDFDHIESFVIKITRDGELDLDEDLSKSILEKISKSLKSRKRGQPVRLAYDGNISKDTIDMLITRMKFRKHDSLVPGGRTHNFRDFINFPDIGSSALRYKKIIPIEHQQLSEKNNTFSAIKEKDVMLFFPYHSYHHVLNLLREASIDPKVESIKITLYRLARNSIIVNALINALKNGKSVTVVLELQARFDEEANIYWANQLQEEGAKVIFGVPGLKVHSKLFLITRKENKELVRYAHVGTGNFNEETAQVYSDISMLTSDPRITSEVVKLFHFYTDNYKTGSYKYLIVAPWFMRKRYVQLINKEISNAKGNKSAGILAKMNNLVDAEMISKLYQASAAGVKIRLIIRGVCSLVPGIKNLSENIEVISIVDKYLEHSRIFIFNNGGHEKYFIASADWMSRNLDHRSEVALPIYHKELQQQIKEYMENQFRDNTKARIINHEQDNQYLRDETNVLFRSQDEFYKLLKKRTI